MRCIATPILIDCVCTAIVEHLILSGISGGFWRNGIHFYTILLNAQPSGAAAKIVPILNRFCVIAAGCTARLSRFKTPTLHRGDILEVIILISILQKLMFYGSSTGVVHYTTVT